MILGIDLLSSAGIFHSVFFVLPSFIKLNLMCASVNQGFELLWRFLCSEAINGVANALKMRRGQRFGNFGMRGEDS